MGMLSWIALFGYKAGFDAGIISGVKLAGAGLVEAVISNALVGGAVISNAVVTGADISNKAAVKGAISNKIVR